jgi:hypothetical protein
LLADARAASLDDDGSDAGWHVPVGRCPNTGRPW